MHKLTYAAYGSNLHPARLAARVPSAELVGTSRLPGFSLGFGKRGTDGSGKCTLAPPAPRRVPGGTGADGVHVAVYTLAADERPALDAFEHAGIGYEAVEVEVPGVGTCFTYLATEAWTEDALAPYCWYREMVVRGCRLHGFPDDYVSTIGAVAAIRDPDDDRRRRNWDMLDEWGQSL